MTYMVIHKNSCENWENFDMMHQNYKHENHKNNDYVAY